MEFLALWPATHTFSVCMGCRNVVSVGFDSPMFAEALHLPYKVWSVRLKLNLVEPVSESRGILEGVEELPDGTYIEVVVGDFLSTQKTLITSICRHLFELWEKLIDKLINLLVILKSCQVALEQRKNNLIEASHSDFQVSSFERI